MRIQEILPILEQQRLPVLPGIVKAIEDAEAKVAGIQAQRYQPDRAQALARRLARRP